MAQTSLTLVERVAAYAADVIHDPQNFKAMTILVEQLGRRRYPGNLREPITPRRGAVLQTGMTQAALTAAATVRGEIKTDPVLRRLEKDGYPFSATNRRKAVSDALQKLSKAGELALVRKGQAGKPNVYRLSGKSQRETKGSSTP